MVKIQLHTKKWFASTQGFEFSFHITANWGVIVSILNNDFWGTHTIEKENFPKYAHDHLQFITQTYLSSFCITLFIKQNEIKV